MDADGGLGRINAVFDRFAEVACGQGASAGVKREFMEKFATALHDSGLAGQGIWSLHSLLTGNSGGKEYAVERICGKLGNYDADYKALILKAVEAAKSLNDQMLGRAGAKTPGQAGFGGEGTVAKRKKWVRPEQNALLGMPHKAHLHRQRR